MATIKSYTDLEQSKRLAEILPIESADMYYFVADSLEKQEINYSIRCGIPIVKTDIPCWSLAALLGILPKGTNISTPNPLNELSYCCWNHHNEIYASNPIDACYEMVIKLHELKML